MPVIKSATKKLRQSQKRHDQNSVVRSSVKETISKYKKNPSAKLLSLVQSQLDKAAKKGVIHANKAARLKSRLLKLILRSKSKTSTQK